jgi:DNA repair ATPase RecN
MLTTLRIKNLALVTAPAAAHYVVTRQIRDSRKISEIALLTKKERVTELAQMLAVKPMPHGNTPRRC